jgi:death-on-curing protein
MKFIEKDEILELNRVIIERYSGSYSPPNNLKNEDALDYLLDIAQNNEIFGVPQYPTVIHVAALYLFKITSNHIFNDGNKRTALKTMNWFLSMNEWKLKDKLYVVIVSDEFIPRTTFRTTEQILEELIQEIAQGLLRYDDIFNFLQQNTEQK